MSGNIKCKCKQCGCEFLSYRNDSLCPSCYSKKLSDAATKKYRDYSFTRAIDALVDMDVAKNTYDAIQSLMKAIPQVRDMTVGELSSELDSRIADIAIEQDGGKEWRNILSDFEFCDYAEGHIEYVIFDLIESMPPFLRVFNSYPRFHFKHNRRGNDSYIDIDGCPVRIHAYGAILAKENDFKISHLSYRTESVEEEEMRIYKEVADALSAYFPKWDTCIDEFKPSVYLQGCLIKHYRCGPSFRDKNKIRPLVSAAIDSLITKEFVTQFNLVNLV